MNFVMWLFVGGLAGWMVSSFMGTPESLPFNAIVGIIGAFVVGLMLTTLSSGFSTISQNNFNFSTILVSWLGAIILLAVINFLRSQGGLLH